MQQTQNSIDDQINELFKTCSNSLNISKHQVEYVVQKFGEHLKN